MRTPLLLLAFALVACSPAQREWRKSKRSNTSEAYRAFALANPTDPHRADALERVEQLDWQRAITRDSADAWGNYVAFHPGSARIGEARSNLEGARWRSAVEENSRQGFDLYLGSHPSGAHAAEARTKLDVIAWAEAEREGTIDSYGRYLVRYRSGSHAGEAAEKREELYWKAAVETDGPMEYSIYLSKFPSGSHADEARAAIEGFRFSGVAVRVVVKSTVRGDSLATWRSSLQSSLGPQLTRQGFKVAWLDVVDGRGRAVDPFADLLLEVPEDHAAMVIVLEESRGRAFDPTGFATDIAAEVFIVPPARMRPFIDKSLKASTGARVVVEDERGLHIDAQQQLGRVIGSTKLGLKSWRR